LITLLLDGDVLAYRAAFSKEVALEVEPGYWTWHCNIEDVKEEIFNSIDFLKDKLKAERAKICLSDDYNFRRDLTPTYKDKRAMVKKPVVLKPIRQWLKSLDNTVMMENLEGDDVMGILQTDPTMGDTIIVSIDKDMKVIPGKLYREDTLFNISEEEANYNFLMQTLTGDITDGYSGIPGVGPVAAKRILEKEASWEAVKTAYLKHKLTEEDALVNARCARILRYQDYDWENNKPILWSP
jgi:DNA polymerase-1